MNATATPTETPATESGTHKASKAPKAAQVGAAATPTKTVKHIPPATAVLAEYANNRHFCAAAPGTLPDDLEMNPEPFALIATNLTRFDDIRVVAAEGTWMADLIVVDSGPGYAICRLVQVLNLPTRRSDQTDRIPAGFEIVQASPGDSQPGWLVIRLSDNVQLNAGHIHQNKEDATRYLLDHSSVRGNDKPAVWRGQH